MSPLSFTSGEVIKMKYSVRQPVLLVASMMLATSLTPAAFAGTLTGSVSDSSGTRVLAGAEVEIVELGRTAQTSADGSFRFTNVPAGRYQLITSYVSGAESRNQINVPAEGTVELQVALGTQIEEILVVGQRAMLAGALSRQRSSDRVSSILTRDAIGQFPDQNVAEAARRVSGVNVLNDQGEGRFIAIRGLDPSLNSASINGARIPSPESDTRSVALDVIPSELVESIEISKTLTPDMDADTIGASVNIRTTRAFDLREPFVAVSAEGSRNDLNGEVSPKGSVDFSYPVNDRLGIAGGLSYSSRETSTDNIESEGWDITDEGVLYADAIEFRDYDVLRERTGGSLSLDYRLSDTTNLYARGLFSQFDDTEQRRRLVFEMDEEPTSGDATTATFLSGDGEISVRRGLKDRFEGQQIQSYELGGETFMGIWTFDYGASFSHAEEHEYKTQDPTRFRHDFDNPGELGVTFDYSRLTRPSYEIVAGASDFLNPATYEFNKVEVVDGLAEDDELTFTFNMTADLVSSLGDVQVSSGIKLRQREKSFDLQLDVYDDFAGDYTLADVPGVQSYGLDTIRPVPSLGAVRSFFEANRDDFEHNQLDSDFESIAEDYQVDEDIYASYVMGRLDTGSTVAIAGVRLEQTRDNVRSNLVELVEEDGTHNGVVLSEDTLFVTPASYRKTYSDWLPSINLRHEMSDDLVLRGGIFKSVVRPGISDIIPRFVVEESDDGEREGEFGNPDLKPYRAWNYDLSAEWYFAPNAVVQLGGFYKTVDNFIVTANFEVGDAPYMGTFNGVDFNEASIPLNGDQATISGVEFNYQQALTSLPQPLNGLLVGFNYTYTDAEGDVNGRSIPLPASSKNTYNAMLGYELGAISLRLTASHRSSYLDEIAGSAEEDRYVKSHTQLDFSANYRVMEGARIYLELVNLNDEPYVAYQRGPGGDRLLQYETYSWTGKLGVKFNF